MRLKEDADYLTCDHCGSMHFPEPNSDGVRVLGVSASVPCPACNVPLVHAAIKSHRIRYCERCRGMLIPMEEFVPTIEDLRSRRETAGDAVRQPEWKDLDRRRNCPQCGLEMQTHPYYGPGNVIIDTCEHCALNWLDYSELDRIVRAPDRQWVADEPDEAGLRALVQKQRTKPGD
jgi:Zn-finger nucleic acid-binding protein